jgi:tRNA G18 (ribose-2'-O)-methylase SpoU
MRSIVLVVHDIRSCHNVGSLLRTAEGLGLAHVYLTGYTPYPQLEHDPRLPHLARKITNQIHKTALGAEAMIPWSHESEVEPLLATLRQDGYTIAALEQTPDAVLLPEYQAPPKVALLLGREVEGIEPALLEQADVALEIPMAGRKESFNVVQAAAMALYTLTVAN